MSIKHREHNFGCIWQNCAYSSGREINIHNMSVSRETRLSHYCTAVWVCLEDKQNFVTLACSISICNISKQSVKLANKKG